jgi:hypothetical protein
MNIVAQNNVRSLYSACSSDQRLQSKRACARSFRDGGRDGSYGDCLFDLAQKNFVAFRFARRCRATRNGHFRVVAARVASFFHAQRLLVSVGSAELRMNALGTVLESFNLLLQVPQKYNHTCGRSKRKYCPQPSSPRSLQWRKNL